MKNKFANKSSLGCAPAPAQFDEPPRRTLGACGYSESVFISVRLANGASARTREARVLP
jgi:hypothetical protein